MFPKPASWIATLSVVVVLLQMNSPAEIKVDETFNPLLGEFSQIYSVALDNESHVLIGGNFTSIGNSSVSGIARLSANGSLDPEFETTGGPDGAVYNVAAMDDSIVIAGSFQNVGDVPAPGVALLQPNGSRDPEFGTVNANGRIHCTAVDPAGRILIAGSFGAVNGRDARYVVRLRPDGVLDSAFSSCLVRSRAIEAGVDVMAIQPDGKVIVGGNFNTLEGASHLARLNEDGSLDATFNGNSGPMLYPKGIVVLGDGSLIVGGVATPNNEGFVRRLLPNGGIDPAFNAPVLNSAIECLAVQDDGSVLIGGGNMSVNGDLRFGLIRLKRDGALDTKWNLEPDGPVFALTVVESALYLGGDFSEIGGVHRNGLARLDLSAGPTFHSASNTRSGEFRAYLQAIPGSTYAIECSVDLQNWDVFTTNTATAAGLEVVDKSTQAGRRFFRARVVAPM